jgi:hypothetical protein
MIFTAYLIWGKWNKGDYEGLTCILDEQEKLNKMLMGMTLPTRLEKSRKDNINMVLGEYNERMGKGWNLQKIMSSSQTVSRIRM